MNYNPNKLSDNDQRGRYVEELHVGVEEGARGVEATDYRSNK